MPRPLRPGGHEFQNTFAFQLQISGSPHNLLLGCRCLKDLWEAALDTGEDNKKEENERKKKLDRDHTLPMELSNSLFVCP